MEDFKQKIVSGFAWEASARLIVQLASWASTFLVARILVEEDYGIVGASGIYTGLCIQIAGFGLYKALVNKKNLQNFDLSNIFWISNFLSVSIYLFLYFAAPYIANRYDLPELTLIIRVAGLMVVFSSLGLVPHAMLMRKLQFRATALISMIANFIIIAMTLSMAYGGWGYWSLIISTISGEAFMTVAFFVVVRYRPGRPKNLETIKPMLTYGSKLLSASLVAYASAQLAGFIAVEFLGVAAIGRYQMAYMLAALPMTKIGELFLKIGFPAFSKIQDDLERTKSVFLKMHRILFMITAPMFAGIALTADLIIPLALGEKWNGIVDPIRILCVLNIFMVSAQLIPRVLEGVGNSTAGLVYQGILLFTGAVAMLIGVQWGLNGMLIGWAIAFPTGYIYLLRVLSSSISMSLLEFLDSIKVTLFCTLIMTATILGINYLLTPSFDASSSLITMITFLCLKVIAGVASFYLSYFLLAKHHLKELFGLIRSS
ncbi:lipopolysaccharide biosynthesis protein [Aurantivibrio infirmus]